MSNDEKGRRLEYIELKGKGKNQKKWIFRYNIGPETHKLECDDTANPELLNAMTGLLDSALTSAPHVDKQYHDATIVTALEFDWKGAKSRRNAVIYFDTKVGREYIAGRSQKLLADREVEEKKLGLWPDWCMEAFDAIEVQAFKYIDGDRSQKELSLMKEDKETTEGKRKLDDDDFFKNEVPVKKAKRSK